MLAQKRPVDSVVHLDCDVEHAFALLPVVPVQGCLNGSVVVVQLDTPLVRLVVKEELSTSFVKNYVDVLAGWRGRWACANANATAQTQAFGAALAGVLAALQASSICSV